MSNDLQIRPAKKNDSAFILKVLSDLGRISFPEYKNINQMRMKRHKLVRRGLRLKNNHLFIGEINAKPCAFLWLILQERVCGRIGRIQKIWVDAKFRRKGIATAFLEYIEVFLKRRKCRQIRAIYTVTNLSSANFLKKNGFKIRRILVEKRIS